MQNLLKGRAGGKAKFHENNFKIKNENNLLSCYLTLDKNFDVLLLYYNFLTRFRPIP
jgi:hypothetical protein